MTTLSRIFDEQGQSLWLDNLSRPDLRDGTLARLVAAGIRGVTANPTIVARAIEGSQAYDQQFERLLSAGHTVEDAYWELVISDVARALEVLRPTFDQSHGGDGFVSIEVAPRWANSTDATVVAARALHERIREPNLLVKIPATAAGVRAIETMIGEGRSINVTLVFSLRRYSQVLDAYLSGLETLVRRGGDLSVVHSVASFFVSRVDTEVDRRLDAAGTRAASRLRGRAAVAQGKLAYQLFLKAHSGERWQRLAQQGARLQRPLWASTSTKDPSYPDTLYVDSLIGPDTVNTLPTTTLKAFVDHGTVARTIDAGVEDALAVMSALSTVPVDMEDVGQTLEAQGIAAFNASVTHVLATLEGKSRTVALQRAPVSSAPSHDEPPQVQVAADGDVDPRRGRPGHPRR
jgi:transaldolase